jgi:hypothetical protein
MTKVGRIRNMTLDLDAAFQEFQRILKRHPVLIVGTGASCAVDPRFGMPALADALRRKLRPSPGAETLQWSQVLEGLKAKEGFEQALDAVLERALLDRIVAATGEFVASVDGELSWAIATGAQPGPIARLLRKLVDGLPLSNPVQEVVTPNYDMLIEHTCDALGVPWTDGFTFGSTRRWDWDAARNSMIVRTRETRGKRWEDVTRYRPHVRLHKVHGSINWFEDADHKQVLRCDAKTYGQPPMRWHRAMITPGRSKYEGVARNRDWFKEADTAIDRASAFLIIGFGFNDDHIHDRIRKRLVEQGCPGIVVTRDCSPKIENWIREGSDLWAVCNSTDASTPGTMLVGPGNVDAPLACANQDLWKIANFVDAVM